MLVIMRRADENGGVGSSFSVGDLWVTLMWVGTYSVKLRVQFSGGEKTVSTIPYGSALRIGTVMICPQQAKRTPYRMRVARLGIDAPFHMDIVRDDIKHRRAA